MRKMLFALGLVLAAAPVAAQTIDKPKIAQQDSWTYRSTLEKNGWHQSRVELTVVRIGQSDMLISTKEPGSTTAPNEQLVGSDWSRFRSVNGKEVVVGRPMAFPLAPGKTWQVDFTEENPNPRLRSQHINFTCTVIGWETVTVPAGSFKAIKIEAEGRWTSELAPANTTVTAQAGGDGQGPGSATVVRTNKTMPQTVTGRLYKAFWYVPEVKRMVKSIEESYGTNGIRTDRLTDELEAYTVAN